MNRVNPLFNNLKKLLTLTFVLCWSVQSSAENKDCWADFFEESQYGGKHLMVEGPAQYESLATVKGENWDKRIHSIKIGPKAKVTVFQNPRFELTLTEMAKKPDFMSAWGITEQDIKEDSELIFTGQEMIHDMGDFNFHKKIRSFKVECLN